MSYTPSHIANYMLDRAANENRSITQMKLLKLVYIGYGWNLSLTDKRLFEEPIYAWQHGPVIRSLYDEFKHFEKRSIDAHSIDYELDSGVVSVPRVDQGDRDTTLILGRVWDIYKRFGAWQLREKTHEPDTPWSSVYKEGVRNTIIPDTLIKPHFDQKIDAYLSAAVQ